MITLAGVYILCRFVHFSALMSLAGAGAMTVMLAPEHYRQPLSQRLMPLMRAASWLTFLSALLLLAAQTGLMGDGWQDILDGETWLAVLQTRFGLVWQGQLACALLGCLALWLRGSVRQTALLLMALAQLAGLAFVGHAAMLEGWMGVLQRTNQMVHLIAAAFWAGGLVPVVLLMRLARQDKPQYEAIRTMMRFSRYAPSGGCAGADKRHGQRAADPWLAARQFPPLQSAAAVKNPDGGGDDKHRPV
ncbi:hypothetical protein VRB69_09990 [Erwinia aphidicola]|uniref:hypothetical protein n=1 Tax=Erwinia aphidicola TaxID=68334 RepID=UPI0030CF5756